MESTLPAIAFAALIIAQFTAVIAVQIYIHADLPPPLSAGHNHMDSSALQWRS